MTNYNRVVDLIDRLAADLTQLRDLVQELVSELAMDELTGLMTRRQFNLHLVSEHARSERMGRPYSLLLLDIDKFKECNDRFGHRFGDEVLREFADRVRTHCRGMDIIGRPGGDEFLILAPETDPNGALELGSRLRGIVAGQPFQEGAIKLTVSIGIATYPVHGHTPEELLELADVQLYTAKRSGGNGVAVATSGQDVVSPFAPRSEKNAEWKHGAAWHAGLQEVATTAGSAHTASPTATLATCPAPGPVPVVVGFTSAHNGTPTSLWVGQQIMRVTEATVVHDGTNSRRFRVVADNDVWILTQEGERWLGVRVFSGDTQPFGLAPHGAYRRDHEG